MHEASCSRVGADGENGCGLDVRLETTVEEITDLWVRLSDGTTVPTHTLVWCVGVTPGPLTRALGLDTVKGGIVVDEFLTVPGHPHVFAAGDAAAVPDLRKPGRLTPMTAQHAQRHGAAVARNAAASIGHGTRKAYKHRDLGFVVDLGGWQAVANPLHVPLSGVPAKILTRAYHLYALPAGRLRVATDWFNDVIEHLQFVQLGSRVGLQANALPWDVVHQLPDHPAPHALPWVGGKGPDIQPAGTADPVGQQSYHPDHPIPVASNGYML